MGQKFLNLVTITRSAFLRVFTVSSDSFFHDAPDGFDDERADGFGGPPVPGGAFPAACGGPPLALCSTFIAAAAPGAAPLPAGGGPELEEEDMAGAVFAGITFNYEIEFPNGWALKCKTTGAFNAVSLKRTHGSRLSKSPSLHKRFGSEPSLVYSKDFCVVMNSKRNVPEFSPRILLDDQALVKHAVLHWARCVGFGTRVYICTGSAIEDLVQIHYSVPSKIQYSQRY